MILQKDMKELYKKYIDDKLTSEELKQLRTSMESSETELTDLMQEEWSNTPQQDPAVSDQVMRRVKERLDREIRPAVPQIPFYYKALGWAASILLPILILSTLYLYHENRSMSVEQMIVSTAQGEKATVTLPDGSIVTLNANSQLAYIPKTFNKKVRHLDFSGEAYFDVAKDKDKPFVIDGRGLKVEVLGTKFNLSVREENECAELFLESGSVQFTSTRANESVLLKPNKKVVMNQSTGQLTLIDEPSEDPSEWRRNEMVFNNASLQTVVASIEKAYNVDIRFDCNPDTADKFSGTLDTNDLKGVLEVLEKTYGLKASLSDGVIVFSK